MPDALMHPNAIGVLRYVSGLPTGRRERRRFLALQVGMDDSRSDGRVLILSGFVAEAVDWAQFSNKWQERLDTIGWPRFKMSEVNRRFNEPEAFRHAEAFYRILEPFPKAFFSIGIDEKLVEEAFESCRLPKAYSNPYFLAYWLFLDYFGQSIHVTRVSEPVEVIFDKQNALESLPQNHWEEYVASVGDRTFSILNKRPRFEKDEDFLPLQAADLASWFVRKYWHEKGNLRHPMSNPFPWKLKGTFYGLTATPDKSEISRKLQKIREQFIERYGISEDDAEGYDFSHLSTKLLR
ncbi:DUF3800 domain-containing protein [Mesorhizobium sp. M0488]|uniref:DUF3800 domain-containing protein n=1 Tax=Mesorhizobium sp. M0488 TaxID=2956949 RepID=UPI00333D7113